MEINNVVVFCGSSLGYSKIYKDSAIALGNYLANNNITMIYGAGKIGMMGTVADTILAKKGKVIGVIPDLLRREEVVHTGITEVYATKTMSERKMKMSKLTDAYIALPGGFGTLDELYEALTLQQLYIEKKPVGILNVNGFFDATIQQLDYMVKEGFLQPKNRKMLLIDSTVEGLMQQLLAYEAPKNTSLINKVVKQ